MDTDRDGFISLEELKVCGEQLVGLCVENNHLPPRSPLSTHPQTVLSERGHPNPEEASMTLLERVDLNQDGMVAVEDLRIFAKELAAAELEEKPAKLREASDSPDFTK